MKGFLAVAWGYEETHLIRLCSTEEQARSMAAAFLWEHRRVDRMPDDTKYLQPSEYIHCFRAGVVEFDESGYRKESET